MFKSLHKSVEPVFNLKFIKKKKIEGILNPFL